MALGEQPDAPIEKRHLLPVAVLEVRDAMRRSAAKSGEPVLRPEDAASAAAIPQRWREQEWLRLTALTIRREAPRATPYIPGCPLRHPWKER